MNATQEQKLAAQAETIVESVFHENPAVIAAYSDGSFSRGDMVRGSDIDIGFVTEGEPARKTLRRVFDGVLFEWALIGKSRYEDVDRILADAGFTHDLVSARIWRDPTGFLRDVQENVRRKHAAPGLVRLRARNQVVAVQQGLQRFVTALHGSRLDEAGEAIVPIVRHGFAVPTAALNKPVTNCRAFLWCRRDCDQLGLSGYADRILDILGSLGLSDNEATSLLALARRTYDTAGLSGNDAETYKAHLEIVEYLIEIGAPGAAMWALFFWTVGQLRGIRRDYQEGVSMGIGNAFLPIREALGLVDVNRMRTRVGHVEELLRLAEKICDKEI